MISLFRVLYEVLVISETCFRLFRSFSFIFIELLHKNGLQIFVLNSEKSHLPLESSASATMKPHVVPDLRG